MFRFLIVAFACLAGMLALPAAAQDDLSPLEAEALRIYKMLPRHGDIIRHPQSSGWTSYGPAKSRPVKAAGVPDGKAQRFAVQKPGQNPWDVGIQAANRDTIRAGEIISTSFWARAERLPKGLSQTSIPVMMQMTQEPYTAFGADTLRVGKDWQLVTVHGEAPSQFGPSGMALTIQAANAKQTIDLGPVFMFSLGTGAVEASAMPGGRPQVSAATAPQAPVQSGPVSAAVQADVDALLARLPAGSILISAPDAINGQVYGDGRGKLVDDRDVVGGKALEVVTPKAGLDSYSTGVNWPMTGDIREGDTILVAVWAKAIDARNESQTAAIQPIRVQQSGEPYASAASGVAYLSRDWELYYVPGLADTDIAAGNAGLNFHVGLTPQTIRIGPSYLIKLPRGTAIENLPRNAIDYAGRAADAPWRRLAMDRIDRHRKADLSVTVRDRLGAPVPYAELRVRQTAHAFSFGSFTGHSYADPVTSDEREWHRVFDTNFNTATLPTYWQDWGWNGSGSNEARYREMIRYAAGRGLNWRAHPLIWPGEDYMPTRVKTASSTAKRRKLVLDHVRDVMKALRDAPTAPIAIDVVNEVRTNRFFQENGDPDLVADVFALAHEIAPDLPLFVNDYGILNNGGQNDAAIAFYHDWIKRMRGQGVPLGGIGFQGHFSAGLTPPERLIDILEGFAAYGLPLHITEFDIETLDEDAQADYTRDAVLAALSVPPVESFVFWQFWEGDHWKRNAAMLREDWTPKPAYDAWRKLVFEDLWTDRTLTTDANGQAQVRAMQGDYEVVVDGQVATVTLDADGETLVVSLP